MEGTGVSQFINLVDKFSSQILLIQVGLILILFSVFLWIWLYNKRRYNHLKHQIPANVVKNYLDSIIQNSHSLKSSLFRGGGLDVDENGVPSVLSFKDIANGSSQVSYAPQNESEELNAKNAEIMRLQGEVESKNKIVRDFEKELSSLNGEMKDRNLKISELEKLLSEKDGASSEQKSGDDEALKSEIERLKKENSELQNRLAEYSIIEDDLADLKKIKQENEQLKRSLELRGGSSVEEENLEIPSPEEEQTLEVGSEPVVAEPEPVAVEADSEVVVESQPELETNKEPEAVEEKSAEDLLAEFEKMLG